jgi:hypothetical protein
MKDVLSGFLKAAGGALFLGLMAFAKPLASWALGLELTNTQLWLARLSLLSAGLAILAGVGWFLFRKTRRQLRDTEQERDGLKKRPPHFQDECIFDEKLGLYRHKTEPGLFCSSCTPRSQRSPLKVELPRGWQCLSKGCEKWHPNPDYIEPPSNSPKKAPFF